MLFILVISLSSTVIMNDTAVLIFIPLVVATSELASVDTGRAVALSAIAANVGSALTPIGNPQNIIIWQNHSLGFVEFTSSMLPFVSLWLAVLFAFALRIKDRGLSTEWVPSVTLKKALLGVSLVSLIADVLLIRTGRPALALMFTSLAFLLVGREVLRKFDWALVLTFVFIFVDFNELAFLLKDAGLQFPREGSELFLVSAVLSQLFSNVPATVLLLAGKPEWLPLSLGVNVGGNGFVIGSLANLIALRIARVSVKDFHRISIPYFSVTLLLSGVLLALF
ncbi:SLC13 family permease [Thermococcus eurythermalis]|uniref:SLC13 family permease n=1 Tax=Thermococcus eurythermalis TaxID=1505907 RepID=UPI000AC70382|nr:SLC13 family permease [Thermococcus eurythermalis]